MENSGQSNGVNYNLIIWAVIFFIAYKIVGQLFGESRTERDADKEEEELDKKSVLDFKKYLQKKTKIPSGKKIYSTTSSQRIEIAKGLISGFKKIDVPEEEMISLIKQTGTKGDMAVISGLYQKFGKSDLMLDIKKSFNDSERKIVFSYINSLPSYI